MILFRGQYHSSKHRSDDSKTEGFAKAKNPSLLALQNYKNYHPLDSWESPKPHPIQSVNEETAWINK